MPLLPVHQTLGAVNNYVMPGGKPADSRVGPHQARVMADPKTLYHGLGQARRHLRGRQAACGQRRRRFLKGAEGPGTLLGALLACLWAQLGSIIPPVGLNRCAEPLACLHSAHCNTCCVPPVTVPCVWPLPPGHLVCVRLSPAMRTSLATGCGTCPT